MKGATRSSIVVDDRLQLGQPLHARLGLGGLGGLGAEAVDEGLQVGALGLLLGLGRRPAAAAFSARGLLEVVVAAGVEVELAVREVQDVRRPNCSAARGRG